MMYDRSKTERLIPGIWDEWRVLELPDDLRPDADMPKAPQVDPRRSTDKVTEVADIQRAWKLAKLSPSQARAVLLVHGLDYTVIEAARTLGISRQAVGKAAIEGVTRLMDTLNGVRSHDDDA